MERICPSCGQSSGKRTFVGEHCIDCYLRDRQETLPSKVTIEICQKCDKVWKDSEWKSYAPSLIISMVEKVFAKTRLEGHFNLESSVWEGVLEKGGDRVPFTQPVELAYIKNVCPTCNRVTSGYFEGIIQLRGDRVKVERVARRLIRRLEKKTFIPKIEDMHGGIDIYLGFKKEVAEILREEKLLFERSEKLAGEKNGKRLYRSTFLIRLEDAEGEKEEKFVP